MENKLKYYLQYSLLLLIVILCIKNLNLFPFIYKILLALIPFLYSFVIALLVQPVIEKIKIKSHGLRCCIVYFSLVLILSLIGIVLVPIIVNESINIKNLFSGFTNDLDLSNYIQLDDSFDLAYDSTINVFNSLSNGVIIFVAALYLSLDFESISSLLIRNSNFFKQFFIFYDDIKSIVFNYLKSISIDLLLLFTIMFITLSLFKVKYAIGLAILMAVLNLIPYIGAFFGQIIIFLISFITTNQIDYVLIFTIIAIQQIESNWIQPYLFGKILNIKPFYTILSLCLFSALFGFFGIILAPILAVVIQAFYQKLQASKN